MLLKDHFQMGTNNEQTDLWLLTELGVKDITILYLSINLSCGWVSSFHQPPNPNVCSEVS